MPFGGKSFNNAMHLSDRIQRTGQLPNYKVECYKTPSSIKVYVAENGVCHKTSYDMSLCAQIHTTISKGARHLNSQ